MAIFQRAAFLPDDRARCSGFLGRGDGAFPSPLGRRWPAGPDEGPSRVPARPCHPPFSVGDGVGLVPVRGFVPASVAGRACSCRDCRGFRQRMPFPSPRGRRWPAGPDEGASRVPASPHHPPLPVGEGLVWCRFEGFVPASVAGRACSYRGSVVPVGSAAGRFSLLPEGAGGPQGRMRGRAACPPGLTILLSRWERGLVWCRFEGFVPASVAGRACSYRGSVVPVGSAAGRFSLLPAGEGGPQGRMRGRAACPPGLTILLSRWERGLVWCRFEGFVPASVAGGACSYRGGGARRAALSTGTPVRR